MTVLNSPKFEYFPNKIAKNKHKYTLISKNQMGIIGMWRYESSANP